MSDKDDKLSHLEYKDNGVRDNHEIANDTFKRGYIYEQWTRNKYTGLYAGNIDQIMFQVSKDSETPLAVFELTSTHILNFYEISPKYLQAMKDRLFLTKEFAITKFVANALNIPAYIVFYPVDLANYETYLPDWMYVYSDQGKQWKLFTDKEWREFLKKLPERNSKIKS